MNINHDFHIHTALSVCANASATVEHYKDTAHRLGLNKLGFADHFWDETHAEPWNNFYKRQGFDHVEEIKKELAATDFGGVQVYFGCETEYDPINKCAAVSPEVAERFDFIIVPNSHTHMMMPKDLYEPYEKHKQFMIDAYLNIINCEVSKYILSMAHPFEAVCCPYPNTELMAMMSDDEYRFLFDKTANKGIGVEINVAAHLKKSEEEIISSEHFRLFRLAKECGCRFTFGSDSHSSTGHDTYKETCETFIRALDLKSDDLCELVR